MEEIFILVNRVNQNPDLLKDEKIWEEISNKFIEILIYANNEITEYVCGQDQKSQNYIQINTFIAHLCNYCNKFSTPLSNTSNQSLFQTIYDETGVSSFLAIDSIYKCFRAADELKTLLYIFKTQGSVNSLYHYARLMDLCGEFRINLGQIGLIESYGLSRDCAYKDLFNEYSDSFFNEKFFNNLEDILKKNKNNIKNILKNKKEINNFIYSITFINNIQSGLTGFNIIIDILEDDTPDLYKKINDISDIAEDILFKIPKANKEAFKDLVDTGMWLKFNEEALLRQTIEQKKDHEHPYSTPENTNYSFRDGQLFYDDDSDSFSDNEENGDINPNGEQNSLNSDIGDQLHIQDHDIIKPTPVTPEERLKQYNEMLWKQVNKTYKEKRQKKMNGDSDQRFFIEAHIASKSKEDSDEGKYLYPFIKTGKTDTPPKQYPDLPVIEIKTQTINHPGAFDQSTYRPTLPDVPVTDTTGALLLTPIKGHINPHQILQKTMAQLPKASESYRILRALMPKPVIAGKMGSNYMLQKTIVSYPPLEPLPKNILSNSKMNTSSTVPKTGKGKGFCMNGGKTFFLIMAFDVGTQSLEKRINNLGGDGSYVPTFSNIDKFCDYTSQSFDELGGLNPGGHYMPTNEIYTTSATGVKKFFEGANYILLCGNDGLYHTVNFVFPEKPLPKEFYPVRALNSVLATTIRWLGGDLAREQAEMEAYLKKNPIIPIETQLLSKLPPKLQFLYVEYKQSLKRTKISCISGQVETGLLVEKKKNIPKPSFHKKDQQMQLRVTPPSPKTAPDSIRIVQREIFSFESNSK